MQLHTSSLVEAVWLVNKQQVVSINPVVQGNQNRQWSIPIQALSTQNTNTQAGSHYHLLIFIKQTDAADYQSFTHFVNQSKPLQANNAAIEFANWANAMELPVFIVDHLVK